MGCTSLSVSRSYDFNFTLRTETLLGNRKTDAEHLIQSLQPILASNRTNEAISIELAELLGFDEIELIMGILDSRASVIQQVRNDLMEVRNVFTWTSSWIEVLLASKRIWWRSLVFLRVWFCASIFENAPHIPKPRTVMHFPKTMFVGECNNSLKQTRHGLCSRAWQCVIYAFFSSRLFLK